MRLGVPPPTTTVLGVPSPDDAPAWREWGPQACCRWQDRIMSIAGTAGHNVINGLSQICHYALPITGGCAERLIGCVAGRRIEKARGIVYIRDSRRAATAIDPLLLHCLQDVDQACGARRHVELLSLAVDLREALCR